MIKLKNYKNENIKFDAKDIKFLKCIFEIALGNLKMQEQYITTSWSKLEKELNWNRQSIDYEMKKIHGTYVYTENGSIYSLFNIGMINSEQISFLSCYFEKREHNLEEVLNELDIS